VPGGNVPVTTIAEAVAAFQGFWADRERWIAHVAAGDIDV
jgi:hypothetical protein